MFSVRDYFADYDGWNSVELAAEIYRLENLGRWDLELLYRCRAMDSLIIEALKRESQKALKEADDKVASFSDWVRDSMRKNMRFLMDFNGPRVFDDGEYRGLRASLRSIISEDDDLYIKLLNEIIFCSRFGYLSTTREGGYISESDSIQLALNIYRRGKWNSPTSGEILKKLQEIKNES